MAYQINTQIEGTIGSYIYYKRDGNYLMRAKGNTGKQGKEAKLQAGILGQASALSGRLRKLFKPMLPGPVNRRLMYRFNNALQQWLRTGETASPEKRDNIYHLQNFSFSSAAENEFYVAMPVSRTANGNLLLHIPAFDSPNPIHPLPFNGQINLHIMAACCNLQDPLDNRSFETTLNIYYDGTPIAAQDTLIPIETKSGCITVVALAVNGMDAGIIGAMYN